MSCVTGDISRDNKVHDCMNDIMFVLNVGIHVHICSNVFFFAPANQEPIPAIVMKCHSYYSDMLLGQADEQDLKQFLEY